MPDKEQLRLTIGNQPRDLRQVRLPGLDKPFEELTVSELVQLRPGSEVADSYGVNAVTDNISVSTSSMLEELGQIQKVNAMQKVRNQVRLNDLRAGFEPMLGAGGALGPRSADPPAGEVRRSPDDLFDADSPPDPFSA